MFAVIGLGNPGKEYINSRHNSGFMVVDNLASSLHLSTNQYSCKSLFSIGIRKGSEEEILLAKPQTYMNLSGESVAELIQKFSIDLKKMIIIHDDIDLEFRQIRLKKSGGSGGHNGLKSIIQKIESEEFFRLRIGIGRPADANQVIDYVLDPFTSSEMKDMTVVIEEATFAILDLIDSGFEYAANKYNK